LPTLIEPLSKEHDRESFTCGVEALDYYFKNLASQDIKRHVAAAFVLMVGERGVAGYYTLSSTAILLDDLPAVIAKKLPRHKHVPATLLGRLAVSNKHRGLQLGELLLVDALKRSLRLSREVGAMAVVVDAKDDTARSFYERYAFISFPQTPYRLFLPMDTIKKSFEN
jgi:GNAT superfamily N-acetyltransferase